MNRINYSNINCNARRNEFVHSLAQMAAVQKWGARAPLPPLGAATHLNPPLYRTLYVAYIMYAYSLVLVV